MASAASSTAPGITKGAVHGVAPLRAGQGTSFFLRRLHSLSGIVPVGAFLFEHILISNATAISGPDAYAKQVAFLGGLPLVFFLELFGIWLPIAFHALYGFYIWYRGDGNTSSIPGPETGCTRRSAGPAASPSPTSSGTPTRCVSPESICTLIPMLRSAKCRRNFSDPALFALLCRRPDRRIVAFRLRHLAVLREVGDHSGEKARQAISGDLSRIFCAHDRCRDWSASIPSGRTIPAADR